MRINLNFELKNNIIPNDYRSLILSFIKHSLEKNFKEAYEEMYNNKNCTVMKSFTFGVYLPNAKIEEENKKVIELSDNYINVTFSIFDPKEFIELYNSFNHMRQKEYPMDNNAMTLKNITMENERIINENKAIIKFLSPLTVRNHNKENNKDTYLNFGDEGFEEYLNNSIERIAKEFNFQSSYIKLRPVSIINENGEEIKKESKTTVIRFQKLLIKCSYGKFYIEGERVLLNNLYKTGIGSRRSQGFGMFEVISQ